MLCGVVLLTGLTPIRPAATARASTAQTMAASILASINSARTKRGLGALRTDSDLTSLASARAAKLASLNLLSHDKAGCLTCGLATRGVSYSLVGEVLASNTYPWGLGSASIIFSSWRGSPTHWDILMGSRFDAIGIGLSRSANGSTYASAILIDAPGVAARKITTATHVTTRPRPAVPKPSVPPRPSVPPKPSVSSAPPATAQVHISRGKRPGGLDSVFTDRVRPQWSSRSLLLALVFDAVLGTGLGLLGHASWVTAGTVDTMKNHLLMSINNYGAAHGPRRSTSRGS